MYHMRQNTPCFRWGKSAAAAFYMVGWGHARADTLGETLQDLANAGCGQQTENPLAFAAGSVEGRA